MGSFYSDHRTWLHSVSASLKLILLAVFGDIVIRTLYDVRYEAAGRYLQILSLGSIGALVCTGAAHAALLAKGDSFGVMVVNLLRGLVLIGCMTAGGWFLGSEGIILGVAASMWTEYFPTIWAARRADVWMPLLDGTAMLASAAIVLCGWALRA